MKKSDFIVILFSIAFFVPFFISETIYEFYKTFNTEHGFIAAFVKFFILATFGESIGLRIREGIYWRNSFGLPAKAVVWGFLGIVIKAEFILFGAGSPKVLEYIGFSLAELNSQGLNFIKILSAFSISFFMNIIFSPVLMTFHKITDIHISKNGGKFNSLLKKINFTESFNSIDWNIQYNFVFKKTIPLFWIPAHTITFLLPADFQVLFAALLGIALGVILALAANKK